MLVYPSKILLFGEYTVLNGSKALATPWYEYSGHWTDARPTHAKEELCYRSLLDFTSQHPLTGVDGDRLQTDLKNGLWFDSSIPHGQGLGSSGALVAALYERYGDFQTKSLTQIKKELGELESYFHGSSSGLDPLVSFMKKTLLIHSPDEIEVLQKSPLLPLTFLVNTKVERKAGPLIEIYKQKVLDPSFKKGVAENLVMAVNSAIENLLDGHLEKFFHNTWLISRFQWDDFKEMIPADVQSIWKQGLDQGDYILKLCGAGGGGHILGFSKTNRFETLSPLITKFELKELKL